MPLIKMFNDGNKKLCNKIGGWILHAYNDAKILTLTAHNWPSRIVATEMQKMFDFNQPFTPFKPTDFDLQYLFPDFHNELLEAIVESDLDRFRKQISSVEASSDAMHHLIECRMTINFFYSIDKQGNEETLFLGIGEVTEPGAEGHVKALFKGTERFISFNYVLKQINHITTDGENKNTGIHKGVWAQLDSLKEKLDPEYPLLKSICSVHTSALAFKDVTKTVIEIKKTIETAGGILSFFHSSPKQTAELEKISQTASSPLRRIPKWFEIRWSEFA